MYANMLYNWSLLDGHKTDGAGRYAARGVFRCAHLLPLLYFGKDLAKVVVL